MVNCDAVIFVRRASTGRSKPPLVMAENLDGELVEVFLKGPAFHAEVPAAVCQRELIAARLARQLEIPCATPALVQLSPEFIASVDDVGTMEELKNSPPVLFGSVSLGDGWSRWNRASKMPRLAYENLASVIVFDHITQNYDRTIANPNLMKSGDVISLIDHEETFVTASGEPEDADVVPTPWQLNRAGFNLAGNRQHALWNSIGPGKIDHISVALESWRRLSKQQIDSMVKGMPDCWASGVADDIGGYLHEAIERLDDVETSLQAMCL